MFPDLADLYAVGGGGAIATNLGASSTDRKLDLKTWERVVMFCTFIVMAAIELSLFIDKPNARLFAATILVIGLILRGLAAERAERRAMTAAATNRGKKAELPLPFEQPLHETTGLAMLCAVRGIGRTLDFAIQEAKDTDRPLYILFVREQPVIAPEDRKRKWIQDDEARAIFTYAKDKAPGHRLLPTYAISDSPTDTIRRYRSNSRCVVFDRRCPQRNALVSVPAKECPC